MNIATVIDWLNKNKGYHVDSQYYKHISVWVDWWRGFIGHSINTISSIRTGPHGRGSYTACVWQKKVCQDWASILLNEKNADRPGR